MDRIGRVTIILATLLLSWGESFPCRAQPPALLPAASRPAPPPASDDQAVKRKPAPLEPTELRLPPLVVPSLEEMLAGAPLGPKDLRFSNNLASAFQLPSQSTAPTAPRATIPPPRQFGQPSPSTAPIVVGFGPRATLGRPLLEAQARAAGAHRLGLPDQPRHRLATLRRPAVDRRRRAGQCLGGRSTAHAGQGPLGPYIDVWRRLYPARRRRPGF